MESTCILEMPKVLFNSEDEPPTEQYLPKKQKGYTAFQQLSSSFDNITPLGYSKESDTICKHMWSVMIRFKNARNRNFKLASFDIS
eukprot:7259148-Ditylum_brightwellii.AAC.1